MHYSKKKKQKTKNKKRTQNIKLQQFANVINHKQIKKKISEINQNFLSH